MEALALAFISPSHFSQDEDQVKPIPGAVWHFGKKIALQTQGPIWGYGILKRMR